MNNGARSSLRRERRASSVGVLKRDKQQTAGSWQPQKGESKSCTSAGLAHDVLPRRPIIPPRATLHAAPADCPLFCPLHRPRPRPMPGLMPVAMTVQLACVSCAGHPSCGCHLHPVPWPRLNQPSPLAALVYRQLYSSTSPPSVVWPLLHVVAFVFLATCSAARAPSTCSILPARH